MSPCDRMCERLPEYIAGGEPLSLRYASLAAHLRRCTSCAAHARALRAVEDALRSYPRVAADPQLTARILQHVLARARIHDAWEPLPWTVWLPGLAFSLAILLVVVSLPAQTLSGVSVEPVGLAPLAPGWVHAWVGALYAEVGRESFWAIWSGVCLALAGIGLGVGLRGWTSGNARSLEGIEHHVSDAAERVLGSVRRAT